MEQDKPGRFKDIWDIIEHYRAKIKGKPIGNQTVEDLVFKRLAHIPPDRREKVITWLLTNRPRIQGLDLMAVEEAVTRVRGYETAFIPAQKLTCACCGEVYQYKEYASDEDKMRRAIFTHCPQCGFDPRHTFSAEDYFSRQGKQDENYIQRLEKYRNAWNACHNITCFCREEMELLEKYRNSQCPADLLAFKKISGERDKVFMRFNLLLAEGGYP